MNELETRFKEAQSQYSVLKLICECQVVRWEYATGPYYETNPIYHQMHGIPKGKLLKGDASNKYFLYQYGFNSDEKLVVSRQFVHSLLPKVCFYEEFFIHGNDVTFGYWFDYTDEKCVRNVTSAKYKDGLLLEHILYGTKRWNKQVFTYESGLIKQVEEIFFDPSYSKNIENRFYDVFYDEQKKVKIIIIRVPANDTYKDGYSRVVYQKPDKGQKIISLVKNIEDKLAQAIPIAVSCMHIKEQVYCLIISYSLEAIEFFPPLITIGLESERDIFIKTEGKRAKDFIWNPAELKNRTEISTQLLGEDVATECQVFNNYIVQNEKWSLIDKVMNDIAERLLKYNWQEIIPTTSDFVIFVEDDSDNKFLKSIKKVNNDLCLAELKRKKLL